MAYGSGKQDGKRARGLLVVAHATVQSTVVPVRGAAAYNVSDGGGGFEGYNVSDGVGGFEQYEVADDGV